MEKSYKIILLKEPKQNMAEIKTQEAEKIKNISDEHAADQEKEITNLTATLWNYNPVPENEPEPFPEYVIRYDKTECSEVIGARVRGKKHKHEGSNCDDWFECITDEDITCIVVSDGAGSKKYSRIGAKTACRSAIGYLSSAFKDLFRKDPEIRERLSLPTDDEMCIDSYKKMAGIVQESMIKAYNAVESAYYERYTEKQYYETVGREINIKDFSSTLLLAVCIPIDTDAKEKIIISCQIGDGMIALVNSEDDYEKSVKLMGEADSGDFSGETDFLVNKKLLDPVNLASRTKVSKVSSDIILIMTDGVADDYFPNGTEIHRLYFDLLANGIIACSTVVSTTDLSSKQIEIIKKIPEPVEYPWINDKSEMVGLNYTKEIMSALDMPLNELWDNKYVAYLASAKVKEKMNTDDPSQRLKIWLDNYVERGSFDDRTLVIARI